MRMTFGEYMPDQPGVTGALTKAENVISKAVGYSPFPLAVNYSVDAGETLSSLFAAKGASSDIYLFAGGQNELYTIGSGGSVTNVSDPGGYSGNPERRWNFVQFGTNVIAANGQQPEYPPGSDTFVTDPPEPIV